MFIHDGNHCLKVLKPDDYTITFSSDYITFTFLGREPIHGLNYWLLNYNYLTETYLKSAFNVAVWVYVIIWILNSRLTMTWVVWCTQHLNPSADDIFSSLCFVRYEWISCTIQLCACIVQNLHCRRWNVQREA